MTPAVQFQHVSKCYPVYDSPSDRLKELLLLNRISRHRDFWALSDLTFDIQRGETFCIIGENGSGKSTLLQIVAGILQPTSGDVRVHGRVAALLELGAGFNPEFTGRDNVYLNGAILGLTSREMDQKYKAIEDFAEIGDFINQPVKTYSSGMAVRLAFAVAIHVDPDILLVDEALAVGDVYFRQRCLRKVHELRSKGVTILFVSHATGDVKAIGDRVLWLENGKSRALGPTENIITQYLAAMIEKDSAYIRHHPASDSGGDSIAAPEVIDRIPNIDHRFGDRRAEILGIAILHPDRGTPLPILEPNTTAVVRISVVAHESIASPIVGFMLRNHLGVDFSGTNTAREEAELPPMRPGDVYTIDFHLAIPELYPATFSFSPAVADGTLHIYKMCDWIDNAITLHMAPTGAPVYGSIHIPCQVRVNSRLTRPLPAQTAVTLD